MSPSGRPTLSAEISPPWVSTSFNADGEIHTRTSIFPECEWGFGLRFQTAKQLYDISDQPGNHNSSTDQTAPKVVCKVHDTK